MHEKDMPSTFPVQVTIQCKVSRASYVWWL